MLGAASGVVGGVGDVGAVDREGGIGSNGGMKTRPWRGVSVALGALVVAAWAMMGMVQPEGGGGVDNHWRDVAAKRSKIRLAVPHYSAKGLITSSGESREDDGFGVRVVVEAAKAVGLEVEVETTFNRGPEELLESGDFDAVTGVSLVDSRLGKMTFTMPIFLARGAVYSRRGTAVEDEAEGLKGKRVVVAGDGVGYEWCVARGVAVVEAVSLAEAFLMVRRGEADYAVTTMPAGRYQLEQMGVTDLVETGIHDESFVRAFAVAVRKDDAAMASLLNVGFGMLESDGRWAALYAEYAEKYQPLSRPPVVSARLAAWAGGIGAVAVVGLSLGFGISSRRLAKRTAEMRGRDEQLTLLSESVPALIYSYVVGREGTRTLGYVSPQAKNWLRTFPCMELGQDYKRKLFEWIHPEDRAEYDRQVEMSRRNLTNFDVVFRLKDATGQYRLIHTLVTPQECAEGVRWNALHVDLTESTRAERVAKEANERFNAIFEGSRDAIIVFRPEDERVLAVNSRACEMYGYSREEMLSLSLRRLSVNESAGRELLRKVEELGWCQREDWRQRRKDGTVVEVQLSGHMVEYGGERAVLSINRDVTEQNRLRQAADRERRVFLGGPTVVFRWANVEGYPIEHVSENVAQFGYTVEDMVSGRVSAATMVHPEDLQRVLDEARDADVSGASHYESEYRVLTKSGEIRWVHDYTALVRDSGGKTLYFEGCLTDQTNLRRAEERRRQLERQLWQSQRVESLGVLVGGVAHDFNNLLVGILGNAGLARRQLDRPEELVRSLGRIEEAGRFVADLIKRLVGHAGVSSAAAEPVDLAALGASMADTLGPRVPRWINVCRAGGPAWTRVDGIAVKQAVMNLLTNAADAIGTRKGEVCVRTGVREFDPAAERECCVGRELPRGQYSFVCVEDSGGGISDEVKARMFEPFVSTGHEGRGLGLALVLSIMRRTGGAVCVRTVRGVGTWFELLWPADGVPAAPAASAAMRDCRTVLVIDDHAGVRGTAVEMIQSMGYRVIEARLGEEGLAMAEASRPDAVLLDVTLPGMSGWQVLEKLRVVSPETRVVMSSGHNVARLASRAKPDALLPKPYVFDDLKAALESLVPIATSAPR